MTKLKLLGIDAAFANMGFALGTYDLENYGIEITKLKLVTTEAQNQKVVRKSSDDLRRARELYDFIDFWIRHFNPDLVIVEVPHGSQSARASWSLGIVVGLLASIQIPMIEVSALEVKQASVGRKTASKQDMIDWAYNLYPAVQWLIHGKKLTLNNEHLADAIATLHAGVKTQQFKEYISAINWKG